MRRREIHFVAQKERKEDRNRDVRRQKVCDIPLRWKENLEAVREREDDQQKEDKVRPVWLEWRAERQRGEQVVEGHRFAEAKVCGQRDDPGDESRDCADVGEPTEHACAVVGHIQECKAPEQPGGQHCHIWHTFCACDLEPSGRLAVD